MVEAAMLLAIVRALGDLLDRLPDDRMRDDERHRDALDQVLAALNLTKAYIADQTRGRATDRRREEQLSRAWTRAASGLEEIDADLAARCRLNGEHWENPTSWDDEDLREARTRIDDAAVAIRSRLTE